MERREMKDFNSVTVQVRKSDEKHSATIAGPRKREERISNENKH